MTTLHGSQVVEYRIRRYVRQAEILRQIHSDKAFRTESQARGYAISTVLVAAIVSLLGFAGPERLAESFLPFLEINTKAVQVVLNWTILAVAFLALLGLVYRFDERSARHHRSIEKLTEFIRDHEDLAELMGAGQRSVGPSELERIRERYKGIAAALPASSDREYRRSKKRFDEKQQRKLADGSPGTIPEPKLIATVLRPKSCVEPDLAARLAGFFASGDRFRTLAIVREVLGEEFWVVGGFVRDPVWDSISNTPLRSSLEDIDVVFFDPERPAEDDPEIRGRLAESAPNQVWSVTNEAHAHQRAGDESYASLLDAISHFPETASAIALRLDVDGKLHILAPYGLNDLFAGVIRRSPRARLESFEARQEKKSWTVKWPSLRIELSEDP